MHKQQYKDEEPLEPSITRRARTTKSVRVDNPEVFPELVPRIYIPKVGAGQRDRVAPQGCLKMLNCS
jgi:hypothetical protein